MRIKSAFLLLGLFALAACSSDSTNTGPSSTVLTPTLGARYIFRDSSTGINVPPSNLTYMVVEATSNSYIWRQDTVGNRFADTSRFWYKMDPSGDLQVDPTPASNLRAGWFRMPYVTKNLVSLQQTVSGGGSIDTVITSAEGESTDGTFTLAGKQYATKRVKVTMTTIQQGGATSSNVYHYQYSPDLGVEVAYDEDDYTFQGVVQEAHHSKLIAIDKK